jgi:photosystem II stability/assembly factor-like uncharacterized protein
MGIPMKKNQSSWLHRLLRRNTVVFYPVLISFIICLVPFSATSLSIPNRIISNSPKALLQENGWEQLESGVTQDLNSVSFICLNRGSIVGDEGVIVRTGTSGDNWTLQDSGVMDNLYDIFYYDYSIILAVGESGTILLTNNTGLNWTVIQTGMIATYHSGQMITDMIGVVVGVNAIFQPFFTKTTDGWNTWESMSFYIEHEGVFYEGWLSDVFFMNASVGFATAVVDVPAGGAIVRTMDGGNTWETVYFSTDELLGIEFTGSGIGYAVGNHGVILQTVDGGETWAHLDSGVSSVLHAIDFPSETKGTAVGDNGIILRTENKGQTWVSQSSGTTYDLFAVRFITDQLGFVAGEYGTILRTKTAGYSDEFFPPITNCTLSGEIHEGVYVSNVTVTFSATDNQSGVAFTTYKLDDGFWDTYWEPIIVSADGTHTVHFYSTDNVGNVEEEKTCEFTIRHLPNLEITITGGFGVRVHVKNLGSADIENESWNLMIENGIIFLGKHKSGIISIKAGNETSLSSLVFGFGKPTLTFSIASLQKSVQGTVFFFFVRISS